MVSSHLVLLSVNKREVDCGGAKIRNRAIPDGTVGRKVDGTVGIESYQFVAGSVRKMFKFIPICSTYVANIIGWFEKPSNSKNNCSVLAASQHRRVELYGRIINIV